MFFGSRQLSFNEALIAPCPNSPEASGLWTLRSTANHDGAMPTSANRFSCSPKSTSCYKPIA
jgi:hypothetical protein